MPLIFSKKALLYSIIFLCITCASLFILPVSIPILLALLTAICLNPLVSLLQQRINRQTSVAVIFLLFLLMLGALGYVLVTRVVIEVVSFIQNAPVYINEVTIVWEAFEAKLYHATQSLPQEYIDAAVDQVGRFLEQTRNELLTSINVDNAKAFFTNIPAYFASFLVYLIALFFFMLDLPRLKHSMYSHFTEKTAMRVQFIASRFSSVVTGFMKAQFLVSILIFIVALIGLLIIDRDSAIVMAILIWIIDVIPILGSIILLAPWAIYLFLIGNIALGTKISILAIILLIIRRTVEPKVMGHHIGLSPLATLISMYIGIRLLGVAGLLIGPALIILFQSAKESGLIKWDWKI